MEDAAPTPHAGRATPSLRGIYRIALTATAVGFGVVILLNLATPLESLRDHVSATAAHFSPYLVSPHVRALFFLGALLIVSTPPLLLFVNIYLKPVAKYLNLHGLNRRPEQELLQISRRRLLNLQFVIIPVNLGISLLLPALIYQSVHLSGLIDSRTALILAIRAIMIGFVSSGVMSLWIEAHIRSHLIPFFFPTGRLNQVPGAIHSAVARRIRLYYRLGSLVPMVILLVTLLTLHRQLNDTSLSAQHFSSGLLLFCAVLFVIFFIILNLLNKLISRSIVDPVDNILAAVKAVRRGDLDTPAAVISNDELGLLGDAVNEMIQGLRERQIVLDTFGKYVTPAIRDEILSGRIPLGGELKLVSVLFCDLRNFTPLVASMPPEEVVRVINGYFEEMAEAIHAHDGLVLQYIGDEIEAVFGAPLPLEQHAAAAASAALEMQARLARYNTRTNMQGRTPLQHGIGIATGEVVAANIGSSQRLSYALVGDTVNLSSRLQGLTKELGHSIIINAATRSALPDHFNCKPLGMTNVKGLSAPVEVFALQGSDV